RRQPALRRATRRRRAQAAQVLLLAARPAVAHAVGPRDRGARRRPRVRERVRSQAAVAHPAVERPHRVHAASLQHPVKYSQRTAWSFTDDRLEAAAARTPGLIDLTVSNPTRVGLPPALALLDSLSDPLSLSYDPHPFGAPAAR